MDFLALKTFALRYVALRDGVLENARYSGQYQLSV